MDDEEVKRMAAKYCKSPAQILLKFLVQNGIAVIPKSIDEKRIRENFEVENAFNFLFLRLTK